MILDLNKVLQAEQTTSSDIVEYHPINSCSVFDEGSIDHQSVESNGGDRMARRRRASAGSKVRLIKRRLKIRLGRGANGVMSFSPSQLVKVMPLSKIKAAAKKIFRRTSTVKASTSRRKKKSGRKTRGKVRRSRRRRTRRNV